MLVGGDEAVWRKGERLLAAGARLELVFEQAQPAIHAWLAQGRARKIGKRFSGELLTGQCLVLVSGTDDEQLARIKRAADRHGVALNVVDRPEWCSVTMPAVVDRDPVTIAIGTGGRAPELARMIRSRLESLLPASIGPLADLADSLRDRIRQRFPELASRRRFLNWLLTGPPASAIEQQRPEMARKLAVQRLDSNATVDADKQPSSVALVGAGPGDPELLTVKALRLIQEAEVIVHDGLVDARVLAHARRDAELIDVTKRRGYCRASQEQIQNLLVEHALAGARVVRLKGGDPMVFGRGGEELQHLRAHGIDYQVVPGITAAVACGAYAGIPLTHRDHAQSVRLVTAHCKQSIDRLDWAALAADHQTLAFYMAVAQLERIQARLLAHGRNSNTPFAVVENGTRPDQRVITGRLDQLVSLCRAQSLSSPALLYIGGVAGLAETLGWFGDPALQPTSIEANRTEPVAATG